MEKLFAALQAKHPGYQVVDVRFMVEGSEADGRPASELDGAFARAVSAAKRVTVESIIA